eukprot:425328_1
MKWGTILFFNGYLPLANQIFKDYATKDFEASAHQYYCGIAANILYELGKQKDLDKMHLGEKLKGQNLWMYRYLCYKYWVEFFVKKKKSKKKRPKQPKTGGKSQYDKAIDCAKKMIRLNEDFPLGHALLARSNIELIESVDGMSDKIEESVNKAVELADQCLQSKLILPRLYHETLIHCGVAMFQIGKDGSSYYNKAVDNAPHGETTLMKLQRERITSKMDTQATRELLLEIQNKNLNMDGYKKALPLFEYDFNKTVNLANNWDIFTPKSELPETGQLGMNITKPDANPNGDLYHINIDTYSLPYNDTVIGNLSSRLSQMTATFKKIYILVAIIVVILSSSLRWTTDQSSSVTITTNAGFECISEGYVKSVNRPTGTDLYCAGSNNPVPDSSSHYAIVYPLQRYRKESPTSVGPIWNENYACASCKNPSGKSYHRGHMIATMLGGPNYHTNINCQAPRFNSVVFLGWEKAVRNCVAADYNTQLEGNGQSGIIQFPYDVGAKGWPPPDADLDWVVMGVITEGCKDQQDCYEPSAYTSFWAHKSQLVQLGMDIMQVWKKFAGKVCSWTTNPPEPDFKMNASMRPRVSKHTKHPGPPPRPIPEPEREPEPKRRGKCPEEPIVPDPDDPFDRERLKNFRKCIGAIEIPAVDIDCLGNIPPYDADKYHLDCDDCMWKGCLCDVTVYDSHWNCDQIWAGCDEQSGKLQVNNYCTKCKWYGTAWFCDCDDTGRCCKSNEYFIKTSQCGDGACCYPGFLKDYCCRYEK